jgi:hypothetical protein
VGAGILVASNGMTHADRARIKRQMSIGSNGENDLNQNAYRIERYIVVHGNKYPVTETSNQYCAQVVPGRMTCGASIEDLRENAEWSLNRAQEEANSAVAARSE